MKEGREEFIRVHGTGPRKKMRRHKHKVLETLVITCYHWLTLVRDVASEAWMYTPK